MFGPRNKEEEKIFAEEAFAVNVQCHVQSLLNRSVMTSKDLGNLLNDHDLVERLFSSDCNVSVKELGRIYYFLDVDVDFVEFVMS